MTDRINPAAAAAREHARHATGKFGVQHHSPPADPYPATGPLLHDAHRGTERLFDIDLHEHDSVWTVTAPDGARLSIGEAEAAPGEGDDRPGWSWGDYRSREAWEAGSGDFSGTDDRAELEAFIAGWFAAHDRDPDPEP